MKRALAAATLLTLIAAHPASASSDSVEAVAAEAGVDPVDLAGASATTRMEPRTYMETVGELSKPVTPLGVWDRLAGCESRGNWATNTGNGFYGGLQFDMQTWRAYGGVGLPSQASRAIQIAVAEQVRGARGYQPWPVCSRVVGLR